MTDGPKPPSFVNVLSEEFSLPAPPFWMIAIGITLVVLTWVPLAFIARARVTTSEKPRVHIFQDMDKQPKYGPQATSVVFADNRAMRPKIAGTVARQQIIGEDHYLHGFVIRRGDDGKQVTDYFADFPPQLTVDEAFVRRGQERFNIYCTPCHGHDGYGQGIVHQRALALEEPKWVPPTSLHSDTVRERPNGHLFNTITNGIRNMAGYGRQIPVRDRWAIVAYVRALQLSQNATLADVPPEKRGTLR